MMENIVSFVGDPNVGKTTIIQKQFVGEAHPVESTIGVDCINTSINGTNIKIYDTAGQEKYAEMLKPYIRNTSIIVAVFDLTDKTSFENLDIRWLHDINEIKVPEFIIIVGNKSDLEDKIEVKKEDIPILLQKFSKTLYLKDYINENSYDEDLSKNKCMYIKTSAQTGENIQSLFTKIAERVKFLHNNNIQRKNQAQSVNLEQNSKEDSDPKPCSC